MLVCDICGNKTDRYVAIEISIKENKSDGQLEFIPVIILDICESELEVLKLSNIKKIIMNAIAAGGEL